MGTEITGEKLMKITKTKITVFAIIICSIAVLIGAFISRPEGTITAFVLPVTPPAIGPPVVELINTGVVAQLASTVDIVPSGYS